MNGNAIRVLLIEDSPGDARLIEESLREAHGLAFEVRHANRLALGLEALAGGDIDAVLLDLGLPDASGLEALVRAHVTAPGVPIVVLTGLNNEELAIRAVQEGAQDYLVKGVDGSQLGRAIHYAIGRKRSDEALRVTLDELEKRNQELESFTYSVSHDLKEPLRTIEAFSQFLLEDYAERLDEQGKDYLIRMGKAAGRLKQMIEELLVLSRLSRHPEAFVCVDVAQLVDDVRQAFQASLADKGGRIEVKGALPPVLGDLSRLEQIFGNLIGNGLKFNKSDAPVVTVGVRDVSGGSVTFFVRDNGIGIEPQYRDQIFGVFQRLHRREDYEGTGAGLAIVKRAAEALHGRVWVESETGSGATFNVTLPLWREQAAAA